MWGSDGHADLGFKLYLLAQPDWTGLSKLSQRIGAEDDFTCPESHQKPQYKACRALVMNTWMVISHGAGPVISSIRQV